MNGKIKFHKPNGPAFSKDEVWYGSSKSKVTIISVEKNGDGKFDYDVKYTQADGSISKKNSHAFQFRYQHSADFLI